mgnify:CR=1 FL=1
MKHKQTGRRIKDCASDRALYAVVNVLLALMMLLVAYPLLNILSSSFSSPRAVSTGRVVLLPVEFSLLGYQTVFAHRLIGIAYRNTIFYSLAGTLINLTMVLTCAYPLSRRDFPLRSPLMIACLITMYFSGGLIPSYILMVQLGLINNVWAMLLPGALSVYNMILTRTYILSNVPVELLEASQIDGCSDARYFTAVLLPLCKPIIAVVALYSVVGHWNSYFNALIYLNDQQLFPLQLILRQILISSEINPSDMGDIEGAIAKQGLSDLLKYALIVVATAPILCVYPFLQRFFVKGVMIGSVKG